MSHQVIPDAAVEAAAIRLYGKHRKDDRALRRLTFLALEAAAPHMLASLATEVGGELQDAPPSNYEEDNYDAGYIAGLAYAQDLLRAAIEAAAPHMMSASLVGHINRGPLEGFVGQRCECGRWFDSDADYIAHLSDTRPTP